MRFRPIILMYEAIFATLKRPFSHQPAQYVGNVRVRHQSENELTEKRLAAACPGFEPSKQMAELKISFQFHAFALR